MTAAPFPLGPGTTAHQPLLAWVRRVAELTTPDRVVWCDPVAELDAALATATACLRVARQRGDRLAAECLAQWIDHRLDQRNGFSPRP